MSAKVSTDCLCYGPTMPIGITMDEALRTHLDWPLVLRFLSERLEADDFKAVTECLLAAAGSGVAQDEPAAWQFGSGHGQPTPSPGRPSPGGRISRGAATVPLVNRTNGPFKPAQDAASSADIAQRFPGFARMRVIP